MLDLFDRCMWAIRDMMRKWRVGRGKAGDFWARLLNEFALPVLKDKIIAEKESVLTEWNAKHSKWMKNEQEGDGVKCIQDVNNITWDGIR